MSSIRLRSRRSLLVGIGTVVLALVAMAPAQAWDPPPAPKTPPPAPSQPAATGQSEGTSSAGAPAESQAGSCHVVSTTSTLSYTCPSAGTAGLTNISSIVSKKDFKQCFDHRLSDAEVADQGHDPAPSGQVWVVWRCIEGVNPKTLDVTGPIRIVDGPPQLKWVYQLVTAVPAEEGFAEANLTTIPYPNVAITPVQEARVGQWIAFSDAGRAEDNSDPNGNQITVPIAGGWVLTATEQSFQVWPTGPTEKPLVPCAGIGVIAAKGQVPKPGAKCWWKYLKSSANQAKSGYLVKVTAHWVVTQTAPGQAPTQINAFDKTRLVRVPISEIQAVNVT